MVTGDGPQLKVTVPPPLLALARAASKAASVQEAGVPVPTTALAAYAGWTLASAARTASASRKENSFCFIGSPLN